MRTVIALILLSIVIAASGCSTGEGKFLTGYDFSQVRKIAVIDVIGDTKSEAVKTQIANFFEMELLEKGYSPVERGQVQALLEEQDFQASGITPEENAVKAGRVLNVPVVMIINIPKFGEEISMTAKMLDVEDGSILWLGNGTAKTGKIFSTVFGAAAGAAAGAIISSKTGSDDNTTGAVIGGVLGGAAGYGLAPQAAQRARETIGKMCESIPSRIKQE